MKIAVRMDDITPDMDWESFYKFKELLDEYGVKPLIGVVPDNQDENLQRGSAREDFFGYIRDLQAGGWSVALHGCSHIYTTSKGGIFPLNHFSEFAGLPEAVQRELLQKGTDIFKKNGIHTDIFMAPGHSYDKSTLKILRELGFAYITDGFGAAPYLDQGLTFLPIAFRAKRDIEKTRGYTTLVYHINGTQAEQWKEYQKLFEAHRQDFIAYSDYCLAAAVRRTAAARMIEKGLCLSKFCMVRLRRILKAK